MAKKSAINKNNKIRDLANRSAKKRAELKAVAKDNSLPLEDRFRAMQKLSEMSPNSSKVRIRNRDKLDGRPRGYIRKFGLSRINLRALASWGLVPGVKKSSW